MWYYMWLYFRCHSTLLDYCSFCSLYTGLNNCCQGRHPERTDFSKKETKLTFLPLQKAFPGAQARGTSHGVRYQGNHPNVKTSLHTVLSSLSNKLKFRVHETRGNGWRRQKSRRVTYCAMIWICHTHAAVKFGQLDCMHKKLLHPSAPRMPLTFSDLPSYKTFWR